MKIGIGASRPQTAPTGIVLDGRKLSVAGTTEAAAFTSMSPEYTVVAGYLEGPKGRCKVRAKTARGLVFIETVDVQ